MPRSSVNAQGNNDTHLTVETTPKVELLKQEHEHQPKRSILPYVKCVVAGFLSLALLSCGVFSKLSVIAVAKCRAKNSAEKGRRYIMLVLILMVPQFVAFVSVTWRSIRKKHCPWPTKRAIFLCVTSSIFEVVGLSFFTMLALTSDNISVGESIAVMTCVSVVSIFHQTVKTSLQGLRKAIALICGMLQLAGFIVVIVMADDHKSYCYLIPLILVSISWLPKMRKRQSEPRPVSTDEEDENHSVQENSHIIEEDNNSEGESHADQLAHPGILLRKKTARRKATMICEGLKLFLTPFVSYMILALIDNLDLTDLQNGFDYLGTNDDKVFAYFLVNIFLSFVGYVIGVLTCSMAIQKSSFALPITLMTPVSFIIAFACEKSNTWSWLFDYEPHASDKQLYVGLGVVVVAFFAQFLSTTYYIWRLQDFIMAKEQQLFWVPSYNGVMLEQNLLLNRKNQVTDDDVVDRNKLAKDSCIFICTTMYHEADYEMEQLLHSIRRIDIARQESKRRIESHIWFDGAVKRSVLNSYVLQLISLVDKTLNVKANACTKYETPYGMELRWRLPGGMHFHIHLKDNLKVKNKKRWSQVMYMSYVLDFKIKQMNVPEHDTYILTTDADIRFDADSVEALLDRLIRDPSVGAVCGRTHPLGHGPLIWYQMFDYAIGHWLQKVANHVLGSVLCCPGCFSVYRATAIRDVLSLYSSTADHAVDFLTKDMGEDRWFCTLMVQAGWRLEYCAAAENFTYCPDNFDEFFKQRRRWIPSTLANLCLLISEYDVTIKNNDTISVLFILYQATNVFATLVSPATVILIMVGGLAIAFENWDQTAILIILIIITLGYGLVCLYTSQDVQLKSAKLLTFIFSLLMSATFVGLAVQLASNPEGEAKPTATPAPTEFNPTRNRTKLQEFALPNDIDPDRFWFSNNVADFTLEDRFAFAGTKAPKNDTSNSSSKSKSNVFWQFPISSWYFFGLVGIFVITALCHLPEAGCLVHGVWYLLCLPSGYLFLIIYSICNLTDRSWGTRENKAKADSGESLTKIIMDKLIWMCHGCKSREEERPAEQVQPASEMGGTSESSTESEGPSTLQDDQQSKDETSSNPEHEETSEDTEGPSSPFVPQSPTNKPIRSALKKTSRPSSPAFRFPGETKERSVHFQSKLPTLKSHTPIGEWLEGKMKQYKGNFLENGYDDTSFIYGITDKDLINIGIETRGHRKRILRDIEQLPMADLDNNVPENVDKWLTDLGLHEYWLKFKENSYDNPKALEDLKAANAEDLEKLLRDDFEILKRGHIKKLTLAIQRLQYPSAIERKIRETRRDMSHVRALQLKEDGDGEERGLEYDFWVKLRELRLLPESKAFGQYSELADKLADLRNSVVLFMVVANSVWIILNVLLIQKAQLRVAQTNNPLGLAFLVVFGLIVGIQFLTMLWHRVSTALHVLARAPFRVGAASTKGWAFNDGDLPPPPSEEELHRTRQRRIRRLKSRSNRELVRSGEFEKSDEIAPLINGAPGPSYQGTKSISFTRSSSKSPLPV